MTTASASVRSPNSPLWRIATPSRTITTAAGVGIIVLGIAAALSPALDHVSATTVLGSLLISAGLLEMIAGGVRHGNRPLAISAGIATAIAGALLISNRNIGVLPNASIIVAWLLTRSVILLLANRRAHGSMRTFLGIAAATDFILGAALFVGISIVTLAVTLFGPSPELLASYGFVLALSFAATGCFLLEVASCE